MFSHILLCENLLAARVIPVLLGPRDVIVNRRASGSPHWRRRKGPRGMGCGGQRAPEDSQQGTCQALSSHRKGEIRRFKMERLPGEGGRRSVSKCKVSASSGRPCEGGLRGRWGKARLYEGKPEFFAGLMQLYILSSCSGWPERLQLAHLEQIPGFLEPWCCHL